MPIDPDIIGNFLVKYYHNIAYKIIENRSNLSLKLPGAILRRVLCVIMIQSGFVIIKLEIPLKM